MYDATLPKVQAAGLSPVEADTQAGEATVDQVQLRRTASVPDVPRHDEVFEQAAFLKYLQRERRRVDRSRAPLSLVVFRLDPSHQQWASAFRELVESLLGSKRETDLVGLLERGRVAVLLIDTDVHGAAAFVRKIAGHVDHLPFEVASGTYPDHLFDAVARRAPELAEFRSLFVEESAPAAARAYPYKRALDVIGAAVAIVLASPLMIATAVAVRFTSRGPVIFRQERMGLHGRPFVFYKFRSMYCDNDDSIHRKFVASLIEGDHDTINQGDRNKPSYKIKHDPRVTPIGRLIRRTSLDELPQLFNVLKGDMSLVGPRPALGYEVEKYRSWHLRRVLDVRPGITGLWQVEGRSRTTFDDMVRLDLRYARSISLATDLGILVRTVAAVVRREGAG